MAVTIKDIAECAGVSFSTVSKALRNSPLVQEATKKKVIEVAAKMGYQPNFTARRLVSKKSGVIGVVWPSIERFTLSALITTINDLLEKESYTTMLSINRIESAIEAFHRFQVDAILLFSDRNLMMGNPLMLQTNLPILNYGIAGTAPYPTIDVQRGTAIELAMQHIFELGHKHIAYIGSPNYHDPMQAQKVQAYQEAMDRYGLQAHIVPSKGMESHDGYLAAKSLLLDPSTEDRTTAIISGSFDLTRGIIRAADESGHSIPNQLSIVCYDNFKQSDNLDIPVTAVGVDFDEIANHISQTLLQMINGEETPSAILLEPELVIRSSTASLL